MGENKFIAYPVKWSSCPFNTSLWCNYRLLQCNQMRLSVFFNGPASNPSLHFREYSAWNKALLLSSIYWQIVFIKQSLLAPFLSRESCGSLDHEWIFWREIYQEPITYFCCFLKESVELPPVYQAREISHLNF